MTASSRVPGFLLMGALCVGFWAGVIALGAVWVVFAALAVCVAVALWSR